MHYPGMAAFEIAGSFLWDPTLVVASIPLGRADRRRCAAGWACTADARSAGRSTARCC